MPTDIHQHRILILDFGSQYTQLIARRLRDIGVYCEVHPHNWTAEAIQSFAPKGIILSGGHETVTAHDTPRAAPQVFEQGCPVLGICYGMQTMAAQLGGDVSSSTSREFGHTRIWIETPGILLREIEDYTDNRGTAGLEVWMSHGDAVDALPPGFRSLARSDKVNIVAMADETRQFYGLQFHPEVTHTLQGKRILERFVKEICQCDTLWTPQNILEDAIHTLKNKVRREHVLLGLSGGVDSSVVAALLHRAIGQQLICVFVDNGLLRQGEREEVEKVFSKHLGVHVEYVDAQKEFLSALAGISDPEQKRKAIGRVFIEVFEREAKHFPEIKWLAQGTIYPDVIESAGVGEGTVIKSHHNVGGLPERMALKLLEPLRELFKDEVRQLGLELGLPSEMIERHPFPGPGLGVRVLGEVKAEYLQMLRKADAIFIEELRKHDLYQAASQAFVVFLPVKSVGVKGDGRVYEYVVSLRAVSTVDFMTAHWVHLPYSLLEMVSSRILNEVSGIARVTYDISSKPPATIEWE